ncbi:MAG TPA: glycosyltransferase family 9 protein [Caulobacteraceae bacterium]|nr:glycosyltransferase family 9 protein [Caulobacteraceae bacterium]
MTAERSKRSEPARPIAVIVDREGLGDVMLKAPFLRALRRAFPAHEVWWIATHQTSMADELRTLFRPEVAKVIAHAGLDGPAGPLLARLRALPPFERVFDARTKISTVALARLGLKHRAFHCCLPGYLLCDGRPPSRTRPRRISERMLSLVACATGAAPDGSGRLEATPAAQAAARRSLPDGRTYVGLAPGSREARKNWPMPRFVETARALAGDGVTPVFLLGPMESLAGADLEAAVPEAIVLRAEADAAAGAALDLLIARGQRLAALLANDNGVGHLLGGAGTAVVSLFGPTDPARWAPVAPRSLVLSSKDFGGGADLSAIPASAAIQAVLALLGRSAPTGGPTRGLSRQR